MDTFLHIFVRLVGARTKESEVIRTIRVHQVVKLTLVLLLGICGQPARSQTAIPCSNPLGCGIWSQVFTWGNPNDTSFGQHGNQQVGVHVTVLPDHNVLSITAYDYAYAIVWNPSQGTGPSSFTPNALFGYSPNYNYFCSGHGFVPYGNLLFVGGHDYTEGGNGFGASFTNMFTVFNPPENWSALGTYPNMSAPRWYPTTVALSNSDLLVVGGSKSNSNGNPANLTDPSSFVANNVPEIFSWRNNTWLQFPFHDQNGNQISFADQVFYPWFHLAPDGRVFNSGPTPNTRLFDTRNYQNDRTSGVASDPIPTRSGRYRYFGSSVMYSPGKILISGGSQRWYYTAYDPNYDGPNSPTCDLHNNSDPNCPTASAEIIDLNSRTIWSNTGDMMFARRHHALTVLPDGNVLATGGTSSYNNYVSTRAVLNAELWNPNTGRWSFLAPMTNPRMYHSTATLLIDGSVLVTGGDWGQNNDDPAYGHTDAEMFYPPYLQTNSSRPTITPDRTSTDVAFCDSIQVQSPQASLIAQSGRVNLVRFSSETHSFNQTQMFVPLTVASQSGDVLTLNGITSSNIAPAAHYMLFVLIPDPAGSGLMIPSVAVTLQLLPVNHCS